MREAFALRSACDTESTYMPKRNAEENSTGDGVDETPAGTGKSSPLKNTKCGSSHCFVGHAEVQGDFVKRKKRVQALES